MKLKLYLKQLSHCLEILKTGEQNRDTRIKNVQSQIRSMIADLDIASISKMEILVKLDNMAPLINRLAAEPAWDGKPETLRPPESGEISAEDKPPDTLRSSQVGATMGVYYDSFDTDEPPESGGQD